MKKNLEHDLQYLTGIVTNKSEALNFYNAIKTAQTALVTSKQDHTDFHNVFTDLERLRTYFFLQTLLK